MYSGERREAYIHEGMGLKLLSIHGLQRPWPSVTDYQCHKQGESRETELAGHEPARPRPTIIGRVKFRAGLADSGSMSPPVLDGQVRDRALRALDQLPPLSPILTRVMATLAQEDISFAEIAKLIEKDTVLSGNVLRVVNSSLYGRRGTISSVLHAVALLGQVRLRNTVLGVSVSRLWSRARTPEGWPLAEFNQHSVATAILSDLLAQDADVPYPEGGFAAGLFHDLGKLLLAVASCPEVDGPTHAELSAAVLARWNIPEAVQIAVKFHHAPRDMDLSHVVHIADRYVNRIGISALPVAAEDTEPEVILTSLGIDEDRTPRLVEEFQAEFETLGKIA